MQKHANFTGWRTVAKLVVLATLLLMSSGAGLGYSAECLGGSGPEIGAVPMSGLRGADNGEHGFAGEGPVEHQVASEVGRGNSDVAHQREVRWFHYFYMLRSRKHFFVLGIRFVPTAYLLNRLRPVLQLNNLIE